MTTTATRPAFYAVADGRGGVRDWITLLHPPYTLWHLSYVAIGAGLVPHVVLWRLAGTLLAFFLAVGVGAHALDELHDRPLGTGIPSRILAVAAAVSIGAAIVAGLVDGGWRLLPFVVVGGVLVTSYSLELGRGVLHNAVGFAAAWGAFPVLVGAYAQHWTLPFAAVVAAAAAMLFSLAQRALSAPARLPRRHVREVSVRVQLDDGSARELCRDDLLMPLERALRALGWGLPLVAVAVLVAR